MATQRIYGRELISALAGTKHVKINANFSYRDLADHHKDFVVRTFFEICEDEYLIEALVGQAEFGPLNLAYLMGQDAYCKALHMAIQQVAAYNTFDELAEYMQCEAIDNKECEALTGMNLFDLFFTNAKRFYEVVSAAVNKYLEKTLYISMDEALPGYLEEQRAIRQSIFDEDAA